MILRPGPGAKIWGFQRTKKGVASFFSPRHGQVIAPAAAVRSLGDAQKLSNQLDFLVSPFPPHMVIAGATQSPVRLMQSSLCLLFNRAEDEVSLPAHEFPGMVDANEIKPKDRDLIKDIEIIDPKVKNFVDKLLSSPKPPPNVKYILVHHNYKLAGSNETRLRADTLVFVFKDRGATYIITRGLRQDKKKFPIQLINIEALIKDDYPKRVVLCPDRIQVDPKIYNRLYRQTDTLEISDLPIEKFMDLWPFRLPTHRRFIELTRYKSSLKETWKDYRLALKDKIFGPGAIGCILQNGGFGLMEGAMLMSILNMADVRLGVIAMATFLLKFTLGSFLVGNQRSGAFVKNLEGKHEINQSLDKKVPLWDIGVKYMMNTSLIRLDAIATGLTTVASLLYFHLFPPIFNLVWGSASLYTQGIIFVIAYTLADLIKTYAGAVGQTIIFKVTENQIRHSAISKDLRKSFWDIWPFHANLEVVANLSCLLVGSGLYSLLATSVPAVFTVVGSGLGVLGLLLCAARFMLPLFGREEKSMLVIKRDAFTRLARMLKISDNVFLNIGDNVKVKKVDDVAKERTLIIDFMTSGVKLHFKKPVQVSIKSSRLGRILKFARKQTITIRVIEGTPKDPEVVLYNYGEKQYSEDEIREKFLEFAN